MRLLGNSKYTIHENSEIREKIPIGSKIVYFQVFSRTSFLKVIHFFITFCAITYFFHKRFVIVGIWQIQVPSFDQDLKGSFSILKSDKIEYNKRHRIIVLIK